jgi:hypothetical protein
MSKTYRWVSPLSWTLLGAALATAGTLGAADDRQLAQLAARVSALERALVVTAGAVELRGPGTSLKLESGTARLRAPAQLQLEATRIEIEAADQMTLSAGRRASLSMKKSGAVSLSGTDVDLSASGRVNVQSPVTQPLKGSKLSDN